MTRPRRAGGTDRAELKHDVERLRRELVERDRKIDDQAKQIAEAEKRIANLERQLALRQQNSTTTSKPPSSDGLAGRQRVRGVSPNESTPTRRPAGASRPRPIPGAGGTRASNRQPRADACRHCQRVLHAREDVGEPRRHQVTELPPIEAHVTEYRCRRRRCRTCGHVTPAALRTRSSGSLVRSSRR